MRRVFLWRPQNLAHIGKHNVYADEAKYVVDHASRPYPKRTGDRKYIVRGRTAAGRALQVIFLVLQDDEVDAELLDLVDRTSFEQGDQVAYVIHARDLRSGESAGR
jgi:hypothetical protein